MTNPKNPPRCWIMRVDHHNAADFLWKELQAGRLRQGWGYQPDQDLTVIAARKHDGSTISDRQRDTWRGNRRMLPGEPDSIQQDDIILVPHLPKHQHWSIARVTGPYRFQIPPEPRDYGHILPVELLSGNEPVSFQASVVAAGLRETMRNLSRLWNVDHLQAHAAQIVQSLGTPLVTVDEAKLDKLEDTLRALERTAWERLEFHFHSAELEKPVVRLLEAVYGGAGSVEHTGGRNENGADAICSYRDPLGIPHRVAVQIKMWKGEADWTRPLSQIRKAVESYDGITAGVVLSTAEGATPGFEEARKNLEKELGVPVRVILRAELVRLFIRHLPGLVSAGEEAIE